MEVYKSWRLCGNLGIPTDAITNIDRSGIVKKEYASYRCNKAEVLRITYKSKITKEYIPSIVSNFDSEFIYEVGKTVKVNNYDTNPNHIKTKGIHFFLRRKRAYLYDFSTADYTGLYNTWYNDGTTKEDSSYINGKLHGLYEEYSPENFVTKKCIYEAGVLNGKYARWHTKNIMSHHYIYKNNKKTGMCKKWYAPSRIFSLTQVKEGGVREGDKSEIREGVHIKKIVEYSSPGVKRKVKKYYSNGKLKEKIKYKNSKKTGCHELRRDDGSIKHSIVYLKGRKHGLYQTRYIDGSIHVVGTYRKGVKVGNWLIYSKEGKVILQMSYY